MTYAYVPYRAGDWRSNGRSNGIIRTNSVNEEPPTQAALVSHESAGMCGNQFQCHVLLLSPLVFTTEI